MKFLTGLSLADWLKIGAGIALAVFAWSWWSRGETIDDLRQSVATEQAKHAVTKASLVAVRDELVRQNGEIDRLRVDADQAKRDLAQAEAASAGSPAVIDSLISSSRDRLAGPVCEPSSTVKGIWK